MGNKCYFKKKEQIKSSFFCILIRIMLLDLPHIAQVYLPELWKGKQCHEVLLLFSVEKMTLILIQQFIFIH